MTEWVTLWRRVRLAGRVIDAERRVGVEGALVRLVEMPDALRLRVETLRSLGLEPRRGWPDRDRVLTAADGSFFFLDLPPGPYGVAAALPRRGPTPRRASDTVRVELTEGDAGRVAMGHVELPLN